MRIPSSAVVDLSINPNERPVEQNTGELILFFDKIVYMRNTDLGYGLVRVITGVDITLTTEWYNKVVTAVS